MRGGLKKGTGGNGGRSGLTRKQRMTREERQKKYLSFNMGAQSLLSFFFLLL